MFDSLLLRLEELDTAPRGFLFGVVVIVDDCVGLFRTFVELMVDCSPLLLTIALLRGVSANCGEDVALLPCLAGEEHAGADLSGVNWPWLT